MYNYQETNRYFAQVANDIKDIAEEEVQSLGADNTRKTYRGIYFTATQKALYSINFNSCLINRVLAPLISFKGFFKTARLGVEDTLTLFSRQTLPIDGKGTVKG